MTSNSVFDKGNLPDDKIILPEGPVKDATQALLELVSNIGEFPGPTAEAAFDLYKSKLAILGLAKKIGWETEAFAAVESALDKSTAPYPKTQEDVIPLVYIVRAIKRMTGNICTADWKDDPLLQIAIRGIVAYTSQKDRADLFCLHALLDIPLDARLGEERPKLLANLLKHAPSETNVINSLRTLLIITENAIDERSPGFATHKAFCVKLQLKAVDEVLERIEKGGDRPAPHRAHRCPYKSIQMHHRLQSLHRENDRAQIPQSVGRNG
jgi:hypothetical protein